MTIKFDVDKRIDSFDAPDFLKWFIIPFIILLILGYSIGLIFVYKDIKKGGYDTKQYDLECEKQNKDECSHLTNKDEYNNCLNFKNDARCEYIIKKTGIVAPIIVYAILPIIISLVLASLLYKMLLYIKNPRVAGGVFIYNALFNK